jgi:hypothetical protein
VGAVTAVVIAFLAVYVPFARLVTSGASPRAVHPVVVRSPGGLLSWRGLPDPGVIDNASGLYLTWVTSKLPLGRSSEREELARVDTTTGDVTAERALVGRVAGVVELRGSLFVTVTAHGARLIRLDPVSLAETGHWYVSMGFLEGTSSIVSAAGGVWVAAGRRLVRFTPTRGKAVAAITMERAAESDVATDATGSLLLVGEADATGVGHIQRRDPLTGRLVAESPALEGVANPFVTSVAGGDVWVSEATGMMGYVRLYSLTSLTPVGGSCATGTPSATCVHGTNAISAQVSDGVLFVTQPAGGPAQNFCAATDGQVLARLAIPASDTLLAVGRDDLFLEAPIRGRTQTAPVVEMAIPRSCFPPP